MMEARLYEKLADQKVHCFLCAHQCHIDPGERGICRVRENRDGTLYSLVYGKLIARHIDPIEKKPLFHFFLAATAFPSARLDAISNACTVRIMIFPNIPGYRGIGFLSL